MMRLNVGFSDLLLCGLLVVGASWLVWQQTLGPDAIATLAGALFGGAAILLGNWIGRRAEREKVAEEQRQRQAAVKSMVAAELVNVTAGLLDAKRIVDAAVVTRQAGGHVPDHFDMTQYLPRQMPFTDSLGVELLILGRPAIDALATLCSNLALTRATMLAITEGRAGFDLMQMTSLSNAIKHDMSVLADAFLHIAPTRELQLPGQPMENAVALLDRLSERRAANH
ncbi:hypothetical protein [Trinickia mobilis]|uniref:hypothetical protein n=1 Tax=Trinickia mobilis TaxID=2816356 RepID=UPI001A8D4C2B|nr:hypothetical protein [Trinickia mobilis]